MQKLRVFRITCDPAVFPSVGLGSNFRDADWQFARGRAVEHHGAVLNEKQKKLLVMAGVVALALFLPVTLAVVGGLGIWRESRANPAASGASEALREAAERAAEVALPAPTLASDAMVVECAPDDLESEVQRVVRLADGVGGNASSWNDGVTIRLVAKIPEDAESIFRDAVTRGIYDMKIAHGSVRTTIVEVLIKPVEPAAKSKKKTR